MMKHEYNPPTSDPHIPDVRNCGCSACRERDELRAEVERLVDELRIVRGTLNEQVDWVAALRAENVKLIKEITRLEGLVEGRDAENVKTFDDMVLVQQRTEAERDALRAELAQERNERDATADLLRQARAENEEAVREVRRLVQAKADLQAENERLKA